MRRPLCAFCLSALGVLLVRSFLPQMGLLLPSAAVFVLCLLVWFRGGAARGYAFCLLLGALLGGAVMFRTDARLARLEKTYAGQEVLLTAEVESVGQGYAPGRVSAVLWVETVDGSAGRFRAACASLPKCKAGDRIRGRFQLDVPDRTQRLNDHADGIALSAEYYSGMLRMEQSRSFRARTARLQAQLSRALRQGMAGNTGGVLAAMVVGDRSRLSSTLRKAYRGAGLSHVLVVSGMHVSIFCGLLDALPYRGRERSRAYRRMRSVFQILLALLLVGVTGMTPSVLRAAVAVWVSALGVWLGGPADTLTSLGAAGVLMCLNNGYAVCDVGFELSFAAVVGTLAGAECARRGRQSYAKRKSSGEKQRRKKPSRLRVMVLRLAGGIWDTLCISACASAATFPVLVLRGLSATLWAVVSGVAVLWLVGPLLSLGLATAVLGMAAEAAPLLELLRRPAASCAEGLAWLLNEWAFRVSGMPGAALWFDTSYAAVVCLLLVLLCVLAVRWKVRLRVAVPAVFLTAVLAFGLETALNWNVVHIELVGSRMAPAVVITQREKAVVLFRGSSTTQQAVETQLEKRNVKTVELLLDLRMEPEMPCSLKAEQKLTVSALPQNTARRFSVGGVGIELWRSWHGCIVRMEISGESFVTLSGTVRPAKTIRADWLMASASRPDRIRYENCLTLSSRYHWMEEESEEAFASCPGGTRLRVNAFQSGQSMIK